MQILTPLPLSTERDQHRTSDSESESESENEPLEGTLDLGMMVVHTYVLIIESVVNLRKSQRLWCEFQHIAFLLTLLYTQNMQSVLLPALDQIHQRYAMLCGHFVLTLITLCTKPSRGKDTSKRESCFFRCSLWFSIFQLLVATEEAAAVFSFPLAF